MDRIGEVLIEYWKKELEKVRGELRSLQAHQRLAAYDGLNLYGLQIGAAEKIHTEIIEILARLGYRETH